MPLAILTIIGALTAGYLALSTPEDIRRVQRSSADVLATNLIAYRSAVVSYLNANPSATGTIADASLTFPPGHVRNALWTNLISGGTLYVYSTSATSPGVAEQAWRYNQRALTVGVKSPGGGLLLPGSGTNSILLPAAIPAGATVMVGQ